MHLLLFHPFSVSSFQLSFELPISAYRETLQTGHLQTCRDIFFPQATKCRLYRSEAWTECYSISYIDTTSNCTSFDDVVEYSQYSYKRVNHYMGWLTLIQGKESHKVPDEILDIVMEDMYERQRLRSISDITQKRVRDTLRKLKLRKAYDHVAQITSRLTGLRPPRISQKTEQQLKNMFLQMQPAFQKHSPKSRTNFLSYPYVLYRCFQILGMTHMLDGINLLKGRDKLEANDHIFRKMCVDLQWPVFELPPAAATAR